MMPSAHTPAPPTFLSRRELLRAGGLGLAGITLPRLLRADATAGPAAKADACILIFLNGGPSHLDMWDMKPQAPDGIRGEFQPIATTVPGIQLSEHLPRLAGQMQHCSLLRSLHHSVSNAHAMAVYTSLTGHDRGDGTVAVGANPNDYPSLASAISMFRPPQQPIVSGVSLPYITKEGAGGPPQPGFHAGFIGGQYDPLFVLKDPNSPDFSVPELTLAGDVNGARLATRRGLLAEMDRHLSAGAPRSAVDSMDGFQQRALDMLTSAAAQQAFRIDQEPGSARESYGRNIYGQSVLLARRLIEAGTRVVAISWAPDANATWDTHGNNFTKLKGELLPQFDAACSSLLADLHDRGMLERTLVAVLGDFGRTPKINASGGGRDHWNYCYTVMLAGGGIKGGNVYGASDAIGAFPALDPLNPGDCIATLYHALGVPHDGWIYDHLGRPHRLVERGEIIGPILV